MSIRLGYLAMVLPLLTACFGEKHDLDCTPPNVIYEYSAALVAPPSRPAVVKLGGCEELAATIQLRIRESVRSYGEDGLYGPSYGGCGDTVYVLANSQSGYSQRQPAYSQKQPDSTPPIPSAIQINGVGAWVDSDHDRLVILSNSLQGDGYVLEVFRVSADALIPEISHELPGKLLGGVIQDGSVRFATWDTPDSQTVILPQGCENSYEVTAGNAGAYPELIRVAKIDYATSGPSHSDPKVEQAVALTRDVFAFPLDWFFLKIEF